MDLRGNHYHDLSKQDLTVVRGDIRELEKQNLEHNFHINIAAGDLSSGHIDYYLDQSESVRRNANAAVGGLFLWRKKQAFANQHWLTATSSEGVIAYLGSANNVSSHNDGLKGIFERQMKFMFNERKRYLWLGNILLGDQVREDILQDPHTATPLDVLFALAAIGHEGQPVSAFTSPNEFEVNMWLESIGMEMQTEEAPTPVQAFGVNTTPVMLNHWKSESAQFSTSLILEKDAFGMYIGQAIRLAKREIGIESLGRIDMN